MTDLSLGLFTDTNVLGAEQPLVSASLLVFDGGGAAHHHGRHHSRHHKLPRLGPPSSPSVMRIVLFQQSSNQRRSTVWTISDLQEVVRIYAHNLAASSSLQLRVGVRISNEYPRLLDAVGRFTDEELAATEPVWFIAVGLDFDTILFSSDCSCILFAILSVQLIKLRFLAHQMEPNV